MDRSKLGFTNHGVDSPCHRQRGCIRQSNIIGPDSGVASSEMIAFGKACRMTLGQDYGEKSTASLMTDNGIVRRINRPLAVGNRSGRDGVRRQRYCEETLPVPLRSLLLHSD